MLQHAVEIKIDDKYSNLFVYVDELYFKQQFYKHLYSFLSSIWKNCLNIIFLACGLDEIPKNKVGAVMFWGTKIEYF